MTEKVAVLKPYKARDIRFVGGIKMKTTEITTLREFKEVLQDAFRARGWTVENKKWLRALEQFVPNIHEEELNKIINSCA